MNNLKRNLVFLFVFSITFCTTGLGQETTLSAKIDQLVGITFNEKDFVETIENDLDKGKENIIKVHGQAAFEAVRKELAPSLYKQLRVVLPELYEQEFTASEIDLMLQFHGKEIGRIFEPKINKILEEGMEIFPQIIPIIYREILSKVTVIQEKKFNFENDADCSRFMEGTFISTNDRMTTEKEIIRKNGIQTMATIDGAKAQKYKIEWVSNSRYHFYLINENGEADLSHKLSVNIYEVSGNTCKYISKVLLSDGSYIYIEGTVRVKELLN